MRLRSLLFVPADSDRKIVRGLAAGADAVILDLEDAVAAEHKAAARARVSEVIAGEGAGAWVRVNALDTGLMLADLAAVVRPGIAGVMLPKLAGGAELMQAGHYLDALETAAGMAAGAVKIVVVATETPAAVFALGTYAPAHPRLAGLSWGAEDLSAAIGATDNKEGDGRWAPAYALARSLCLLGASAAGVAAIDTLQADYRDLATLRDSSRAARQEGFRGRLAIHPDQVAVINEAFSPDAEAITEARAIVAAFAAHPGAGTIGYEGRMLDRPHLIRALKTLEDGGENIRTE